MNQRQALDNWLAKELEQAKDFHRCMGFQRTIDVPHEVVSTTRPKERESEEAEFLRLEAEYLHHESVIYSKH